MERSENLRYILRTLLDERPEYAGLQIPDSLTERLGLMRSLLNVRPPAPVSEDFLKAQDAELRMQARGKGVPYICRRLSLAAVTTSCGYGRATLPACKSMPSSMPPTAPCWGVSFRCTAASTTPYIRLLAYSCGWLATG